MRRACSSDLEAVEKLVATVDMKEGILEDLKQFNKARRDKVRGSVSPDSILEKSRSVLINSLNSPGIWICLG